MVTLRRYVLIKYRELELAPTNESVFDRVFPPGIGVPSYKKTKEHYRASKSVSAAASPL